MKLRYLFLPLSLVAAAGVLPVFGQDTPRMAATTKPYVLEDKVISPLVGDWKNELGSTLRIKSIDAKTGAITGEYLSPSGAGPTAYPLVGWVNSKLSIPEKDNVTVISFSVRWGEIGSITTWNGTYRAADATITGQWLLARPVTDFKWDHVLTGVDHFTKK